jgi:hypothetical protein
MLAVVNELRSVDSGCNINLHCITVSFQTAKFLQSCDLVHVD